MKLTLVDRKPQREDYWSAAYSVTLRTPVLIRPDGGGHDRFYSVYRISDEEFEKYDTDEFDDVIASVKENMQDRYLGRTDTLFDIASQSKPNIEIKSSYSEERKIKNNDDLGKTGEKIDHDQYFSVYYSKLYGCYVLDIVGGGPAMYSIIYKISKKEYEQFGTVEFYKLVDEVRSGKHGDRFLHSPLLYGQRKTSKPPIYNKHEISDANKAIIIFSVVVGLLLLLLFFIVYLEKLFTYY